MADANHLDRIVTREELNRMLWGAADILRGTVDAGDFKNHILALMFLKRLSDVFKERRQEIIDEWMKNGKSRKEAEKIAEDPDEYTRGSYYIPEGARWEDLMKVGENRAEAVDTALHAIEEQNAQYLEGVLAGVRFNDERRFGDPVTMDGLMQRLLTHFGNIPLGNRNLAEPDVLGNAYEYLIERFAEGSGKKGGEFYTPRMVVKLIVQLLKPTEKMRIHDPTCGSGGMLIECGNYVIDHGGDYRNITLTGQEKNYGTWSIAKLNMMLHNFPDTDIRAGDTILRPQFEKAGVLDVFDRVIANPPFSLKEWHGVESDAETNKVDSKKVGENVQERSISSVRSRHPADNQGRHRLSPAHGRRVQGQAAWSASSCLTACCSVAERRPQSAGPLGGGHLRGRHRPAREAVLRHGHPGRRADPEQSQAETSAGQGSVHRRIFRRLVSRGKESKLLAARRHSSHYGRFRCVGWKDKQRKPFGSGSTNWPTSGPPPPTCTKSGNSRRPRGSRPRFCSGYANEAKRQREAVAEAKRHVCNWLEGRGPDGEELPAMHRSPLEKFAAVATLDEIAKENDFNLNISRYVDSTEPPPQLGRKGRTQEAPQTGGQAKRGRGEDEQAAGGNRLWDSESPAVGRKNVSTRLPIFALVASIKGLMMVKGEQYVI